MNSSSVLSSTVTEATDGSREMPRGRGRVLEGGEGESSENDMDANEEASESGELDVMVRGGYGGWASKSGRATQWRGQSDPTGLELEQHSGPSLFLSSRRTDLVS